MAFVRGERVGLDRLKRVLPNIFETFQGCDPRAVLVECGLAPCVDQMSSDAVTFFFAPEQDGRAMYDPEMHALQKRSRGKRAKTSDELVQDYAFGSSS